MFEYVKIVSRLSNVIKWNKDSDVMESMLIPIKKGVNILTYVDFSKTCHVIKCCPDLKQAFGKEDITFPLSSSSRSIE